MASVSTKGEVMMQQALETPCLEDEEVAGLDEDAEGAKLVFVRVPSHHPPINAVLAGVCCVITRAAGYYAALEHDVVPVLCTQHEWYNQWHTYMYANH